MNTLLAIAAGGALGSVARYLVVRGVQDALGAAFPWGTLAVNVLGSFAIGALYVWSVERAVGAPEWRAFAMVGVLGGFTTFSSFSLETLLLLQQGAALRALANVVASVAVCCFATALGIGLGRLA